MKLVRVPVRPLWAGLPVLLVALVALVAGCGPYPENTFAPTTEYAHDIANVFIGIIVVAVVVFALVEALLIYAAVRFRGKPGDPRPRAIHGNTRLEIIWTILPVIVLIVIAIPTIAQIFQYQGDPPPNSLQVTATGHQWWFEFKYPDQKIETADEMHLVVGRTANLALQSNDVLHSFWPPKLAGKRDMIPNHTNYMWFTPQEMGTDLGSCVEFCGESHAKMGFSTVIQSPADFDAWVKAQQAVPAPPTDPTLQRGAKVFQSAGCSGCHTIAGTQAKGMIGPNLTHVGSRETIAATWLTNDEASLKIWIRDPAATKPGEGKSAWTMPAYSAQQISDGDLDALAKYLKSLK